MTGRLIASLLWTPVLLLPPLRRLFGAVSVIFWPSGKLEPALLGTPIRHVFVALVFAVGYSLTAWVAGVAIRLLRRRAEGQVELLHPHGGDVLWPTAVVVTGVWLAGSWVAGTLHASLVGAAALVLIGLWGGKEVVEFPPSDPLPFLPPEPRKPLPGPTAPQEIDEDVDKETEYWRVYEWLFREEPYRREGPEHRFRFGLVIRSSLYQEYRARSHEVRCDADYVSFVDAELDDEIVTEVAARIRNIVNRNGLDRLGEIHLAMAFTLSFRYASDSEEYGGEYPKYPVETLVDKRGDCEDHAILCGAVLHRLGHRVALVLMNRPEGGHAALAVESPIPVDGLAIRVPGFECRMFYCEVTPPKATTTATTTAVQWWLGKSWPGAGNFRAYPIGLQARSAKPEDLAS